MQDDVYDSMAAFLPQLSARLQLHAPVATEGNSCLVASSPWSPRRDSDGSGIGNSLLGLAKGAELDSVGLGCFQLGHDATFADFAQIRLNQSRLSDLKLLARLRAEELGGVRRKIGSLKSSSLSPAALHAINDLSQLLASAETDEEHARIKIYSGLNSGFQTDTGTQYWGLYELDHRLDSVTIYLSNNARDRVGTILHTFLSSRNLSCSECFLVEQALAESSGRLNKQWQLCERIVGDIERLSPSEAIMFHKRLQSSMAADPQLCARMSKCLEYQLLEVPSLTQQRALASVEYLGGIISADELVKARLSWLAEKGCWIPDRDKALALFVNVEERVQEVLLQGETNTLEQLSVGIRQLLKGSQVVDAGVDVFALAVFSAFRKLALDEVYLEVLDRNVYPNHAADQAGCFAENFALGSRCESFFDTTPRALGRIIADRYRVYYMQHQPPVREEMFTELPTAYAAMQVDFDPDHVDKVSIMYRFTFFAIFAVPALIDVLLLTTIGRGLYLTTFMTPEQKTMATTALMLALLMSGGFGSWICSGGSYYFYANAFPAMNLFVLTRWVAGFATTIVVAVCGFIVVLFVHKLTAALVFVYYFFVLSVYLMVLNALSIYQQPGSSFLSGRSAIFCCVPILFISPIVTLFTQRDIIVYPSVIACFLIALLFSARRVLADWSSWYLKIPFVTDSEVIGWYREHGHETATGASASASTAPFELDDNRIMPVARAALHAAVVKESKRFGFSKSSAAPVVKKLAKGYQSTVFLMRWYCRHKRSRMPLPYSTTWNLTLKAGMENMTNMQKGLKLHSAFLHWRATGRDIWSGLLYFIVALLDKWVALLTGSTGLVGLSAAGSNEFRLGIGFGLCYYLVGAVSLDIVSQPLWSAANEKSTTPVTSLDSLKAMVREDAQARRRLYWTSLLKFFFLHIWGVGFFSALMWIFQSSRDNTIIFIGYVGAYSGLLWYQFNKIFCGSEGGMALAIGALVALPTGVGLTKGVPQFKFGGLVSLAVATWISCMFSLYIAKIGLPSFSRSSSSTSGTSRPRQQQVDGHNGELFDVAYSAGTLDMFQESSQKALSKIFDIAQAIPKQERYFLDPAKHPGERVLEQLTPGREVWAHDMVLAAFPAPDDLLTLTMESWKSGKINVELVSSHHFASMEIVARSVSRHVGDRQGSDELHIFVVLESENIRHEWTLDIHRHWKIISEEILRAAAQHLYGMSRHDAILTPLLVAGLGNSANEKAEVSIPEGVKNQLEMCSTERARFIQNGRHTLLRYLFLGVDVELEWDLLPRDVRSYLLKHCDGSKEPMGEREDGWFQQRLGSGRSSCSTTLHVARCQLGATIATSMLKYAEFIEEHRCLTRDDANFQVYGEQKRVVETFNPKLSYLVKPLPSRLLQKFNSCIKFLIIPLTADPEYQRELDFVIQDQPGLIRWPLVFFLNAIWSYCKFWQNILISHLLFQGRDHMTTIKKHLRGMTTVLEKRRIVTESFSGPSTWFWDVQADGSVRLTQYNGLHENQPTDAKRIAAVNSYSEKLILRQRDVYDKGVVGNSYRYEYRDDESQLPLQRQCVSGNLEGEVVQYDRRGYITSGSAIRGVNRVTWQLWYRKNAKHEDELLWGEFTFPHITIKVLWSMPPRNPRRRLDQWIPFSTVTEATFIQGDDVYHASWDFEHKLHPEVSVTLNGNPVATPLLIKEDWFHVLQKPETCSFESENPILSFSSLQSNPISRLLGFNTKSYPIPTSVARTQLWKAWKDSREVDAVSARWLDEKLLRSDQIMRPYWRRRDFGRLEAAAKYLDAQADTIMARVDLDSSISSWVHIAFKMADFYNFGPGGDARINTRKLESQLHDTPEELHVLAMDTSTWPNDPGGVSACRRDMVNDLKTIKWHVVAESANDYGVPRFQIERNVQSLTILPLWGMDFLNPAHGVLETSLDSAVVQRTHLTRTADIAKNFLPILTRLVRCSRTIHHKRHDIEDATVALVELNTYFENTRNWNDVWQHPVVKAKWRELWLSEDMDGALNISQWWDFEKPSLKQLDQALDLWCRYLFIFSLPVPEQIPDVFQASHHFTGAMYGIVCKAKRGCSLHIWDHCISFREFTTFMSSAVSYDAPFVNSSLISLTHLSCILLEHHADVVLPCCDYFNPGWEVELGTAEGALEHRRTFARKIDPVVNGICNMDKFEPIETIKTDKPTVIMLSHVQYAKDIKNAIMATDIIVNKWGITDYRLHVYGDQERAATIATECQELIASKNLQEHCILKGLGNPSVVLQDAWLFLNSSISEGLPLAMGEAALTGVPVVCTDVGASYCVVTDRATGDRFSEVVSPNDSESLARAQISVMALLGPWAKYAEDQPGTDVPVLGYPMPSPEQVEQISRRMYAKTEQRRALGMRGRQNVLNNFSSERYLREHEQMLWVGKYRSQSFQSRTQSAGSPDGVATPIHSNRASRLTPESWSALSSTETLLRPGWRSIRSSTISLRDLVKSKVDVVSRDLMPTP